MSQMKIAIRLTTTSFLAWIVLATASIAAGTEAWDVHSDTWVATDSLGRSLPTFEEVGSPRSEKFVGIFYFLWLGQHGNRGPYDITKILAQDPTAINNPDSPLWAPMHDMVFWGESRFGYYRSNDESVLRKHAQMLGDAGVDVVIFDVTNQLTYPKSWQSLCRVFDQARREGNRVPQIAFLCPFLAPRKVVRELWDQLYGQNLYPDLWFRWEGKPLLLANPALIADSTYPAVGKAPTELSPRHTLGCGFTADKAFRSVGVLLATQKTTDAAATLSLYQDGPQGKRLASRRFENITDNAWLILELGTAHPSGAYYLELSEPQGTVGWWTLAEEAAPPTVPYADGVPVGRDYAPSIRLVDEEEARILDFFTFRSPQHEYFVGPRAPGDWGWLEVYPQHAFYKTPGVPEEVTVGVAQNAVDGKLSAMSNPRSRGRSFHDGNQPGPEGQDTTGRNFAEQWNHALKIDPSFIFIVGWNEWITSRYPGSTPIHDPGPVVYFDEFSAEYSRDIEPMLGGHGDNYYYQMIANIRRYKGVRSIPPVEPRSIAIDGKFDDWQDVQPEFCDTIGDPVHRNHPGWGKQLQYVNQTGRNDIIAAKVSYDAQNIYFYVRTRDTLTPATDPNWMLLFIDTDNNPATGWLGYDVVVNRKAADGVTALERNVAGKYEWASPTTIAYRAANNEIEMAIPRNLLGIKKTPATLDFKWADNIQQTGDWSDLMLNGDAAPNDRYNYRATLR